MQLSASAPVRSWWMQPWTYYELAGCDNGATTTTPWRRSHSAVVYVKTVMNSTRSTFNNCPIGFTGLGHCWRLAQRQIVIFRLLRLIKRVDSVLDSGRDWGGRIYGFCSRVVSCVMDFQLGAGQWPASLEGYWPAGDGRWLESVAHERSCSILTLSTSSIYRWRYHSKCLSQNQPSINFNSNSSILLVFGFIFSISFL